nr:interferon-induced protein with tetratricopeptide repeats 2-like isoform X2 [Pogona vitticeps]
MQSRRLLWEKLRLLQCHFTWNVEFEDQVDVEHLLQFLTYKTEFTPYHNHGTYTALKAFLYHRQKRYCEALKTLKEAEMFLAIDQLTNITCHILLIYGNYAWVYYHLSNYDMTNLYLHRIQRICQMMSSPEPYSVKTGEILAQKGWSLLAAGFRNGPKAKQCFEMALRQDLFNLQFWSGLAVSLYATWEHLQTQEFWGKAKELLEGIVLMQPGNYEMKVYLATLLCRISEQRVNHLLEEVVEQSRNPEVLRKVARLYMFMPQSLPLAISILKEAIALAPTYDILHYDLGMCYRYQMERGSPEERAASFKPAIESFQRAVEVNSLFFDPMLELAKLYGMEVPDQEEEVYANLAEKAPHTSASCRQALCLQWGDFLLQKKGLKDKASEKYMAGLLIAGGHSKEKDQLVSRLVDLAKKFQEESEVGHAEAIRSFLQAQGLREAPAQRQRPWWLSYRALR